MSRCSAVVRIAESLAKMELAAVGTCSIIPRLVLSCLDDHRLLKRNISRFLHFALSLSWSDAATADHVKEAIRLFKVSTFQAATSK